MWVCGGEKHQRARAIPTHFYFYYYFNVSRQQNWFPAGKKKRKQIGRVLNGEKKKREMDGML
jgi:hypothetical protein